MVRGAIYWYVKTEAAILHGWQTAETYCDTLKYYHDRFVAYHLRKSFFYQISGGQCTSLSGKIQNGMAYI